jgi:hypothetical protein
MSKRDEYLANAAECQRIAARTRNDRERRTWQDMAGSWLRMAKDRDQESHRPSADGGRSATA